MCHTQSSDPDDFNNSSNNGNVHSSPANNSEVSYETVLAIIEANNCFLVSVLEKYQEMTQTMNEFELTLQDIKSNSATGNY
ncbi:unnamed protein product [Blepharisma stoltei]|uniref:Uncharacterized protein n=1 Tax=Blepharisma stoltei TaxID=1481888 RepID=A0AAU9ITY0_9CILI|nr:unnamed protein product [Blepharisma stoltei]